MLALLHQSVVIYIYIVRQELRDTATDNDFWLSGATQTETQLPRNWSLLIPEEETN